MEAYCTERVDYISFCFRKMGFLQRFGYLEGQPNTNSEALFREEAVIEAIRTMQSFGGLAPTGKMDNETLQVNRSSFVNDGFLLKITEPLCGLPAVGDSSLR